MYAKRWTGATVKTRDLGFGQSFKVKLIFQASR